MKEFKERLLWLVIAVVLAVGITGLLYGIGFLINLISPIALPLLILLAIFIYFIYIVTKFIYWLFIEPFRTDNAE